MAKLVAHGYEVARLTVEVTEPAPAIYADLYDITEQRYRYVYSFRSDGHILKKVIGHDVHPRETESKYRRHDFGWKLWRALREPKRDTHNRVGQYAERLRDRYAVIQQTTPKRVQSIDLVI